MTEKEVMDFLITNGIQMHVRTLDEKAEPNIHPVWYYYESMDNKVYFNTFRLSKKISIQDGVDKSVYFCIDEPSYPYRGVREKVKAKIHDDITFNITIIKKIMEKYYGSIDHSNSKAML